MAAKLEKMVPFVQELPCDERKAITSAALAFSVPQIPRRTALRKLERIVYSIHRTEARRRSDYETDQRRRRTVGTKVQIETWELYRDLAAAQGISLNKWVNLALQRAAYEQGW